MNVRERLVGTSARSLVVTLLLAVCTFASDPPSAGAVPVLPTMALTEISIGSGHVLFRKADGSVWASGTNRYGELATPTNIGTDWFSGVPRQVTAEASHVAAGSYHSVFLKPDGTVWTFGSNVAGALGSKWGVDRSEPEQVMSGAVDVAAGGLHTVVLKADGSVWTFGSNLSGQLGREQGVRSNEPENAVPSKVFDNAKAIFAGLENTAIVRTDGSLWMFGDNSAGQLGVTNNLGTRSFNWEPLLVMAGVNSVALGSHHTAVLKSDRTVWTFGNNRYGQLGSSTNNGTETENPVPVMVASDVATVAAAGDFTLVSKVDSSAWAFGSNNAGQIGTAFEYGDQTAHPVPQQIDTGVAKVVAGGFSSGLLKPNGPTLAYYAISGLKRSPSYDAASPALAGGALTALQPARLMDTRVGSTTIDGRAAGIGRRAAGSITRLTVKDRGGAAPEASASVLTVTVTNGAADGYVTVWPCGGDRPNTSNVNFVVGETVANAVVSKVGTDGQVCLFTSAVVDLIVDVSGYYASRAFAALVPARVFDSRVGSKTFDGLQAGSGLLPAGAFTVIDVGGRADVPNNVRSVFLNVTVTATVGDGYLTVWDCSATRFQPRPNTSTLNYRSGATVANAILTATAGNKVCVFNESPLHLIVDVGGYAPMSGFYESSGPARMFDSRIGSGPGLDAPKQLPAGHVSAVTIASTYPNEWASFDRNPAFRRVPDDVTSAALNITIARAAASGFATVWPCGTERPNASNVNFSQDATVANFVLTGLGIDGKVCIYTSQEVDVIVDLIGWYRTGFAFAE
jgi:alpha-tubulin suppressor-like RCC1 family protein